MSRPEILFRLQEEMRAAQRGDAETSKKEQIEGGTFYPTLVFRIRLNTSRGCACEMFPMSRILYERPIPEASPNPQR